MGGGEVAGAHEVVDDAPVEAQLVVALAVLLDQLLLVLQVDDALLHDPEALVQLLVVAADPLLQLRQLL